MMRPIIVVMMVVIVMMTVIVLEVDIIMVVQGHLYSNSSNPIPSQRRREGGWTPNTECVPTLDK